MTPLPVSIRELSGDVLGRLAEARDFYLHTRQAWRVVQLLAHDGRSVGIIDEAGGRELPPPELEARVQRYVTVHLAESTFKQLSGLLEDWILGLARLWLTAYPRQLEAASREASGGPRSQRRDEIQIPLSDVLAAPDREALLAGVAERIVRDLAYRRPGRWFEFLDGRVGLGLPTQHQRAALVEMKAARDALEHRRGVVGRDYFDKAGSAARYAEGQIVQIEEPHLLGLFELLREVVETMSAKALLKASGAPPAGESGPG